MIGIIYRIKDNIFLSLFDSINNNITNGIPISENSYETLQNNQVSVVDVILSIGLDKLDFDINNFVDLANKEKDNISYNIKDIMVYTINDTTIEKMCENNIFTKVVIDIIKNTNTK